MKQIIAFADEFGNNSFKFETESSHFIIASIITNSEEIDDLKKGLEQIRIKYFQKGEIKSNKVGNNHNRRKLILTELTELNFAIYAVIVDKRKLYGEGFKYKRSFHKFLNGILYKELYRTYPELELIVDEHGGNDFMKGFKKYVEKNHIGNLFSGSQFYIRQSHSELGVQLADFIAGTLGYIYDEHKKGNHSEEFTSLIHNKLTSLNNFPDEYELKTVSDTDTQNIYDSTITALSLYRINDYLQTKIGDNAEERDRINFLKLLKFFNQSNPNNEYTSTNEFMNHLNVNREKPLKEQEFRNKIVAVLRDKGVLIASSGNGYKIPTNLLEIKLYINHGKNIILPMIKRIQECRKAIKMATENGLDILDEPEFVKLKKIIENAR